MPVMTVIVLHTKVPIGGYHQGNLCQQLFHCRLLVAKFVGRINTETAVGAGSDGEDQ